MKKYESIFKESNIISRQGVVNQSAFDKRFKFITKENVDLLIKIWGFNSFDDNDIFFEESDIIGTYMDIIDLESMIGVSLTNNDVRKIKSIKNRGIATPDSEIPVLLGGRLYLEPLSDYLNS